MTEKDITGILADVSQGDTLASEKLLPLVYGELRRLAAAYFARERPDHTLQPTALVHEAYLRLVSQSNSEWQNRAHFFGMAANMMRRILVDHARKRAALKHGGQKTRIALEDVVSFPQPEPLDLVAVDDALDELAGLDSVQGRIVELRFFGGLTIDETADVLGISPSTVKREWAMARAWLFDKLSAQ